MSVSGWSTLDVVWRVGPVDLAVTPFHHGWCICSFILIFPRASPSCEVAGEILVALEGLVFFQESRATGGKRLIAWSTGSRFEFLIPEQKASSRTIKSQKNIMSIYFAMRRRYPLMKAASFLYLALSSCVAHIKQKSIFTMPKMWSFSFWTSSSFPSLRASCALYSASRFTWIISAEMSRLFIGTLWIRWCYSYIKCYRYGLEDSIEPILLYGTMIMLQAGQTPSTLLAVDQSDKVERKSGSTL